MIHETIELLGYQGRDRVTGFEGVVASITFDLYGCVLIMLTPPMGNDGKLGDPNWFDVHRIEIISEDKVMPTPSFAAKDSKPENYTHGPAQKPIISTKTRR